VASLSATDADRSGSAFDISAGPAGSLFAYAGVTAVLFVMAPALGLVALWRASQTLVLDEGASLLDPGAVRRLERAAGPGVQRGRALVTASHRLQGRADTDLVFTVGGGRAVEWGSRFGPLQAGGSYAVLWRTRRGRAESPGVQSRARNRGRACRPWWRALVRAGILHKRVYM
jgi:hypothetical protein